MRASTSIEASLTIWLAPYPTMVQLPPRNATITFREAVIQPNPGICRTRLRIASSVFEGAAGRCFDASSFVARSDTLRCA